jgi:uncharacterized protein
MAQTWQHVLFAHWPVDPSVVQASLPAGIVADTLDGAAWISVVPFQLAYMPRGLAWLPYRQTFTELNLRTYVRKGNQTGVYFYTLEASHWPSVKAAQALFHLAYRHAQLDLRYVQNHFAFLGTRASTPGPVHVELTYQPLAETLPTTPLNHFLTERYRLFTTDATGAWFTVPIWHTPWSLQPVEVTINANTLPAAFGFNAVNPLNPVLCHYAQKVTVKTGLLSRCR